jgi:hypothetical protein
MEVLCAHFLLLSSLLFFSPSASPFIIYLCRVFNVHNWAFDLIRFFDPLFSLCLSLQNRLGIGCVFSFFFHEISGEDEETEIVYTE